MVDGLNITRRNFLAKSTKTAAGIAAASAVVSNSVLGANDRINVAVIGLRSRGREHCREFMKVPNVRIKTICDADENFFQERAAQIQELQGKSPDTEYDLRRIFDDKDIDAVSIATPDHWHALATIWACQAGKHVYVEKPTSHNIWEGRKMIEAARKYNRVVTAGMQNRSLNGVISAMKFLHEGGIGDVYMARALCFKPRDSIGKKQNAPIPDGVHYDLWLGPAPWRPFNPNRFHYNWHWFWDYGMPDMGNQGPHQMDIARWGMNKNDFPCKIKSVGGYFAFDSDQETPNTQSTLYEYNDGKILQFETRGLYTNDENGILIGNLFYGSEGWMHLNGNDWKTFFGRENTPGPSFSSKDQDAADPGNLAGSGSTSHFLNFIDAVRSENWMDLNADIIEGYKSTTMVHLGNISYRTGRELTFDSHTERFVGDEQANGYLTRNYRNPYVVPDKV
ncbi:Gfo/Idh/MocA family protein [Candidatus Latescibacterota bacterium]